VRATLSLLLIGSIANGTQSSWVLTVVAGCWTDASRLGNRCQVLFGLSTGSSGWGDGSYPSFWGYDAGGQRVALVTDFGVLDVPQKTTLANE
jgi:hypothetical protein